MIFSWLLFKFPWKIVVCCFTRKLVLQNVCCFFIFDENRYYFMYQKNVKGLAETEYLVYVDRASPGVSGY